MGIDTYLEPVVYMRGDCEICRSEGFESQSRIRVNGNGTSLIATLNVVQNNLLSEGEAGFSSVAWRLLGAKAPCPVTFSHPERVDSFRHVRSKLFGHTLQQRDLDAVIGDIVARRYSDVQLSAFLAACSGERMTTPEIVALTRSMISSGEQLDWGDTVVYDKHCVGGLPGNRTTPIVVAIVAACGLMMPKTSSRAITSPAGTADTMETLTRVDLSLQQLRSVVEQEGGCLAWGGSMQLSPADDILIRVERALDLDSEAQLTASVLSKKAAAGATRVVIDIPVGPTAKVRDTDTAVRLSELLRDTAAQIDLDIHIKITDGIQPVGYGIGPALEARDVLAVLQNLPNAAPDLRMRSLILAGAVLEFAGLVQEGKGSDMASAVLNDGRAWRKFQAICNAQGGLFDPPVARLRHIVTSSANGRVESIDNRKLAKIAKLAGAPGNLAAGVDLHVHIADRVAVDDPLFTLHSDTPGELAYALAYIADNTDVIRTVNSNPIMNAR